MKLLRLPLIAVSLGLLVLGISLAKTDNTADGVAAAEAWLGIVDAGQYATSWDESASLFQRAISREDWEKALNATRSPLGALGSRSVSKADYATSLPGAPDGEYVVIQFTTSFANKASAVETVTPMKDTDGTWRVSGYFIK